MKKLVSLLLVCLWMLQALVPVAAREDTSLSDIKKSGVIRIGITGAFPPSNYHENGDGELTGYEVEATKAIIDALPGDIKIEWVEMKFSSLIGALDSGRIDAIFHSMGITEDRAEAYNFTLPYFRSTYAVLVNDKSDLHKLADLKGKKAAQSITTSTGKVAESLGATIVPIETVKEAVDLVVQGRADFYIADKTGTQYFLQQQKDLPVHIMEEEMKIPHEIGAVLPKGADQLRDALNEAIKEKTKDGSLSEIYLKYLDRDIAVPEFK